MSDARRVVIAPDSFKGSASAPEISAAIAAGWRSVRPQDELRVLPMADGGEGTVDAFASAVDDARVLRITVDGPDDRPAETRMAMLPDGTAVVEVATTSGLGMLHPLRPRTAHTRGLGQAIAVAMDAGASRVLIGLGGSASTDAGMGALATLGARFSTADGTRLRGGNADLALIAAADLAGLRPLPPGGAVLLTDVRSPLLGPAGASRVFGPQKGASPADVDVMEVNLRRFRDILGRSGLPADDVSERPGSGAAGGTGFGLMIWGAQSDSGADAVAERIGLPDEIRTADLVITGEGRYDAQTAEGKVSAHVAELCAEAGVPVALIAGVISEAPTGFYRALELAELAGSPELSLSDPLPWAYRAGSLLASNWPAEPVLGQEPSFSVGGSSPSPGSR